MTISTIKSMTAAEIQKEISNLGLTRSAAADHFGFANPGALGNALGRYHPGVVFLFAKASRTGKAPDTPATPATPATGAMGKPVAACIQGFWQAMAGTFQVPALDKPIDLVAWFAENQASPFVAGLDGSQDHHVVDAFCMQFGVTTPLHSNRMEQERAKLTGQIRAAVKAVSLDGRFVVGPLGASQAIIDHSAQIAAIAADALELATGVPASDDNGNGDEVAAVSPDLEAAAMRVTAAKSELAVMERQLAALVAAIRFTLRDCRMARDEARDSIASMEASMQPLIAKLANKQKFTAEQSTLIQSAMGLGMTEQEAIAFLKSKGKL